MGNSYAERLDLISSPLKNCCIKITTSGNTYVYIDLNGKYIDLIQMY